jgi:hypothetical protein
MALVTHLKTSGRKSLLCISIETVEVPFFVIGLETLQNHGVEGLFVLRLGLGTKRLTSILNDIIYYSSVVQLVLHKTEESEL